MIDPMFANDDDPDMAPGDDRNQKERRALQIAVIVAGFVPVGAGLAGALSAGRFLDVGPAACDLDCDSHIRYLSGLLLGIGLTFWSFVPRIERVGRAFGLLTLIVVVGGLARLFGVAVMGWPGASMTFALAMELVITPALFAWQQRIARRRP